MISLWRDVREHRVAAVLLLVWWIALMAGFMYGEVYIMITSVRQAPVVSDLAILFPAFPVVAAILAGWWRATARQSGSWLGPSLLSGLLAALTSSVAAALFAWGFDSLAGPLVAGGDWRPPEPPGYAMVPFFSVFGFVVGVLGGTVGGLAAWVYWWARGSRGARSPA